MKVSSNGVVMVVWNVTVFEMVGLGLTGVVKVG